ncbi:cytochrome b562 [Pseudoalteromonas luteoviolacea]|uniref:cytochrome b562 n=1 Tax=Pseudoalteromonas luteoviolacea TaxID=43657 RepID=UPI00163CE0D2|nr:cytochrome b562 [Pseudoalteromonas luteoviolacea]
MKFVFITAFLLSSFAIAKAQDLNQVMKKMGHEYKLAIKSQTYNEMSRHIAAFILLVEQAKEQKFTDDKAQESLKGLNLTLELAKQAAILANEKELDAAKLKLKEVDELRIKYHKLHEPPSVWELLFGG